MHGRFLARSPRGLASGVHARFRSRTVGGVILLGLTAACLFPTGAMAFDPEGDWWVADRTARIRVVNCAGTMWGIVSWESQPGLDTKNPDPAKRSRTVLGMPVLLGMKEAGPNQWAGAIYNSADGKIYSGSFSVPAEELLRVRGCVLRILCGSQIWTRVPASAESGALGSDAAICSRMPETR